MTRETPGTAFEGAAIGTRNDLAQPADECREPKRCGVLDRLLARIAELEQLNATDYLTGAWNRAHFNHIIESELDRSLRHRQPLSLLMLDIDFFKRANDLHGHQTGDSVLRELAAVLSAGIRSSDALFRWGGEEFAVLAASTGYRGASILAETLRGRVEQHVFAVMGKVTVSIGVAEHHDGESVHEWFGRADRALYAAKRGGRNRVSVDACGNSDIWAAASGASALRLAWQEAYECGEPDIDREHRELFDLSNALIDATIADGDNPERTASAFDKLIDHVEKHFVSEETLLARHGYAHLEAHKKAHARLLKRAKELKAGQATLGSVVEFLAIEVVARHYFKADRDFFHLFSTNAGNNAVDATGRDPLLAQGDRHVSAQLE